MVVVVGGVVVVVVVVVEVVLVVVLVVVVVDGEVVGPTFSRLLLHATAEPMRSSTSAQWRANDREATGGSVMTAPACPVAKAQSSHR